MLVVGTAVVGDIFVCCVIFVVIFQIVVEVVERIIMIVVALIVIESVDVVVLVIVFVYIVLVVMVLALLEGWVLHDFLFDAGAKLHCRNLQQFHDENLLW